VAFHLEDERLVRLRVFEAVMCGLNLLLLLGLWKRMESVSLASKQSLTKRFSTL
jgi:hypothetical protein